MLPCWEESARRLIEFGRNYPEVVYPEVRDETRRGREFERLKSELERSFLECEFSGEIDQILEEISQYRRLYRRVSEVYSIVGIVHSPEFGNFLKDYSKHLMHLVPVGDLVWERANLESFRRTGLQKVKGSIKTNLRTLYQNFVVLSILVNFSPLEPEIIFPGQDYIKLKRRVKGEKKLKPNFVIEANEKKSSFFVEALLGFSGGPRPDIMIYARHIEDIWRQNEVGGIVPPDMIIECKEVQGWYERKSSSSIDAWWAEFYQRVGGIVRNNKVKVNELQIVKAYKGIYQPKETFLVSKVNVPPQIRESLEENDIKVIENTSFVENRLNAINECLTRLDSL